MSRTIVVIDRARDDIEAARDFYDECEPGIGDYFVDCILSDISSLQVYFGLHRVLYGFNRLLSKRFPFAVYYEVVDEIIYVAAILDMRMHPSRIRSMVLKRRG
jgi:hypothetical protein